MLIDTRSSAEYFDHTRFMHAKVLRFAADKSKAREALRFLAGLGFDAPEPSRRPWLVVPWLKKPEKAEFELRDSMLSTLHSHNRACGPVHA